MKIALAPRLCGSVEPQLVRREARRLPQRAQGETKISDAFHGPREVEYWGHRDDAGTEQFSYDAIGNRVQEHRFLSDRQNPDNGIRNYTVSLTGQVSQITSDPAISATFYSQENYEYDNCRGRSKSARPQGLSSVWIRAIPTIQVTESRRFTSGTCARHSGVTVRGSMSPTTRAFGG